MSLPSSFEDLDQLCLCHDCDLAQRRQPVPLGYSARCRRCGAALYHGLGDTVDRTLALAVTGLILLVLANCFPFLSLNIQGRETQATLWSAVLQLRAEGREPIAALVAFTTIAVPLLETLGLIYVLLPLRLGARVPWQNPVFRVIETLAPWGMIEVFLVGVLVAIVKLAHLAHLEMGWSLWLLAAFMLVMAAVGASLDEEEIWERLGREPHRAIRRGAIADLWLCSSCGQLAVVDPDIEHAHCARCGASQTRRKPDSLSRSWALVVAAAILYIPANTLPIMHSSSVLKSQVDTILSGVIFLWKSGSWPLALVVFVASIVVPLLKLFSLALLLVSVQFRWQRGALERTKLYRLTEFVGRWSMVDIFVVTVLVALVNTKPVALVEAGPGALAFGAVVVLTMLAALSFDPRLIWDVLKEPNREP